MPSPNNVLTADSYIQDGLVFQLDGIEYGGVDGQWIDRKGGINFNGAAVPVDNGFLFSGKNADVMLTNDLVPVGEYFTAEVVFYKNGTAVRILNGGMRNHDWRVDANGMFQRESIGFVPYNFIKHTIYYSKEKSIDSGMMMLTKEPPTQYQNSGTSIGGRRWGNFIYNPFKGYIYAVRIYSRQLSDREILINQKIDNARFQLGLDIPDEVLPANRSLSLSEPFELPDESMTEQDFTNETSDER